MRTSKDGSRNAGVMLRARPGGECRIQLLAACHPVRHRLNVRQAEHTSDLEAGGSCFPECFRHYAGRVEAERLTQIVGSGASKTTTQLLGQEMLTPEPWKPTTIISFVPIFTQAFRNSHCSLPLQLSTCICHLTS